MNSPCPSGSRDLEFFGAVMASISHELKNAIAIVNESGGLLQDLLELSERRGQAVDPGRIAVIAERVQRHCARADDIVRGMNAFSHTADTPVATVEADDVVRLGVSLMQRIAGRAGLVLEPVAESEDCTMTTSPFLCLQILWFALGGLMKAGAADQTVEIASCADGQGVRVEMRMESPPEVIPGPEIAALLEELGGRVDGPAGARVALGIWLPGRAVPGESRSAGACGDGRSQ